MATAQNIIYHDVDEEIIERANKLLSKYTTPSLRINSVDDILVEHFALLYGDITGDFIPGSRCMQNDLDRARICHFIIQSLADDVFGIPLDHIPALGIVTGNRRNISDLLEIFEELVEETSEKIQIDDETRVNTEDIRTTIESMCAPLRKELLGSSHRGAIDDTSICWEKWKPVSVINKAKDAVTQTTPGIKKTSQTSPIVWSDVLRRSVHVPPLGKGTQGGAFAQTLPLPTMKHHEKSKLKPVSNPSPSLKMNRFGRSLNAKPSGTTSNVSAKPMKRVQKPKPVISSKLRRKSSSGGNRHQGKKQQPSSERLKSTSCFRGLENLSYKLKLLEDEKEIRSKRMEITRQIKQLEAEEKRLEALHNIILKDLRLTLTMATRQRHSVSTTCR